MAWYGIAWRGAARNEAH